MDHILHDWTHAWRRYWLGDLAGWVLSTLLGAVAWHLGTGLGGVAVGATLGENLGFYGAWWLRERRGAGRATASLGRRLLREFAVAEACDSLLVRPGLVIFGATLLGPWLGVALASIAADQVFYLIAARSRATCAQASACSLRRGPAGPGLESRLSTTEAA